MQNNFNDTIKNLQEFSFEPSAQVWQEIENNLDDKRKKRIVAWWWSMPVVGLLTFIIFIYNKSNTSNEKSIAISLKNCPVSGEDTQNFNEHTQNFDKHTQSFNEHTQSFGKHTQNFDKHTQSFNEHTQSFGKHTQNFDKHTQSFGKHTQNFGTNTSIAVTSSPTYKKNNLNNGNTSNILTNESPIFTPNNNTASEYKNKMQENVSMESNELALNKEKIETSNLSTVKKDSNKVLTTAPKLILPKPFNKKVQLSLAFGTGANYLSRNNALGVNKNVTNSIANSTATTGSVQPNIYSNLPLPKTGFNFSAGVNVDYNFSKKWSFQSGLMYSYLENKIDLNPSISTGQDRYVAGNSITYKNHFHLLEIPLNAKYCVNPNSKNKLSVVAGTAIGFSLGNNWLYANDEQSYYTTEKSNINHTFINLQTGALVNFNNKFSVSIMAKKYVTTVQKSSSKYYWQQLNFQINIPFK